MKKLLAALTALSLLLPLSACGHSIPQTPLTPVPPILRVVTSYGGDDGNRAAFENAVRTYETRTGVHVLDRSAASNEAWKARVLADFETGSEPDVLFFFTNADADPFLCADKVVSIDEIRAVYPDYASNMREELLPAAANGNRYAVPAAGFWETMFVNRTVLEDCGVALPGPDYTWDQFLLDCRQIQEHGYTPIACSLFEVPHYWFEFAVLNHGTLEDHLTVPHSPEDPAGQAWTAALEDLRDLYRRGFFPADTLTTTDAEAVARFSQDQAAFLIDGSWKVGYFTRNHPDTLDHYAVSYVPGQESRPATDAIGGISMGYFITRKAWDDPETRQAAVDFVSLLTSDEVLSTFVTTEATALREPPVPADLNSLQQSAARVCGSFTGTVGTVQDRLSGEVKAALFSNISRVVTGELSPEAAISAALAP